MKIEKISKETASKASYIYAMSWKIGYKGIIPQPYLDNLPLERWADKLGNTGQERFRADYILSDNGKYVATSSICAGREEQYKDWGEVMSIYVLPEEFRKGYGKALLSYVTNQLRENGYSQIYLWVLEENQRARSFYEKMGFQASEDRIVQNIGGKDCVEIRYRYPVNEKITLCGDNCIACPRYNAHTDAERRQVAELWYRVGWRDRIVSNEEIACRGCSQDKQCTYHLVECTKEHHIEKCSQCSEFPCQNISDMLNRSKEYQKKCREVCTQKEYAVLEKAFFEKEQNLKK